MSETVLISLFAHHGRDSLSFNISVLYLMEFFVLKVPAKEEESRALKLVNLDHGMLLLIMLTIRFFKK